VSNREQPVPHIRVRRYSGSARINHWIVAISFVLLLLSGLSLFHPSLYFIGTTLFGSGQTVRWLHPWIGLVLALSFLGMFLRFFPANLPAFTDFVWIARIKYVLIGDEERLPELGKYNAGQKFVFWSQAVLIAIMLVTGIGLWNEKLPFFERVIGYHPTVYYLRWAAVIHATAAVLAIIILVVHVYAAIWVRGTIPAMTEGSVTGGWGWRHHRKWLRKQVKDPNEIESEGSSGLTPAE
jgi:formate dehydrogenase subunit gamma